MKIFHLIFSLETGGAETMLVDIVNEQCKSENVSLIIINDKIDYNLFKTIDPKVRVIELKRSEGQFFNLFILIKLWYIIMFGKPDIIHCHHYNILPFISPWKRRSVVTIHDVNNSLKYLNQYRKVFSISNAVALDLKERGNIISIVVFNGIHLNEYHRKEIYKYKSTEQFRVIQISRLTHLKKGQDTVIKALVCFLKNRPDSIIHLDFVGDGPSLKYLQELTSSLNVSANISFLGQKSRQWVKENLHNYHLLVQPSIYEGFGLTVVEAIAAGLPLIVSDIDGPKEILTYLKVGNFFEPSNFEELSLKIDEIYKMYLNDEIEIGNIIPGDEKFQIFNIRNTSHKYIKEYNSF